MLIALMMAVLVGFAALAIDSARAFDAHRVLQDSTDAAALDAAEYYQNGASWSAAQTDALHLFERDNRLYAGEVCSPGIFATPTPGSLGTAVPVVTTCTMSGGSGYVLTLSASDFGPAGQTFAFSATRPLTVALMQVLGQSPTLTVTAAGSATADDQAATPALGALGRAGCFGIGGTTPLSISTATSPYLTVLGDVVSNGAVNLALDSYLHLDGDLLARCNVVANGGHVTYECWPGGATPSPLCPANNVAGSLRSTSNNFADPQYAQPPGQAAPLPLPPANAAVLTPGLYSASPFTNANACYFLAGGNYEWPTALTTGSGIVSNELRPPDEPASGSPTVRSADQFWEDWDHSGSANQYLHCDGAFALNAVSAGALTPLAAGSYSIVVTSVRTDSVNGTSYLRESAPSMCKSVSVGSGQVLQIVVSNVPGAQSYNVYAANNGSCTTPFGLVTGPVTTVPAGSEKNNALTTCPDVVSATPACSLGQVRGTWDGNGSENFGIAPPASLAAAFAAGFTGQTPARATPPAGDIANENHCGSLGASVACPLPGSRGVGATLVTPGAVQMQMTNNSCLNVLGGDAYLFSGYQYDWVLNYETPATNCTNTVQGRYNSALIGMSYTPGAGFHFSGSSGSQTNYFGGVVAATILVQNAGTLALNFNPLYAPRPPGTRLTG